MSDQMNDTDNPPVCDTETATIDAADRANLAERPARAEASTAGPETGDTEAKVEGIEQTRANIGQTLDAIKDKLDPHALFEQAKDTATETAMNAMDKAKETVHDMVTDVTEHAKDSAKEAVTGAVSGVVDEAKEVVGGAVDTVKGAGSTIVDLVKRNPMPAALIGIGAVWLYMLNRDQQSQQGHYDQRNRQDYQPRGYGQSGYAQSGYQGGYAQGEPYYGQSGQGRQTQQGQQSMADSVRDTLSDAGDKVSDIAGQVRDRAGQMAESVGDTLSQAKDRVGDAMSTAADSAKDFGSTVVDVVRENPIPVALTGIGITWLVLSQVNTASGSQPEQQRRELGGAYYDARGNLRRRVPTSGGYQEEGGQSMADNIAHTVADKAGQLKDRAADWGSQAWDQTTDTARSAATSVRHSYYSGPLTLGVAALGLGALAGLLVPGTAAEDRLMGETRDRLADQATDKVHEVKEKVQKVAEDTMHAASDAAKETAQHEGLTAGGDQQQPGQPGQQGQQGQPKQPGPQGQGKPQGQPQGQQGQQQGKPQGQQGEMTQNTGRQPSPQEQKAPAG